MIDPDAPSRRDPNISEVKHWLVGNILGNDVRTGEVIAEYLGSKPPQDTEYHRYVFLVYQQPGIIDYSREPRSPTGSEANRYYFSTPRFAKQYMLGHPVAGNFFVAQWDQSVGETGNRG